MGFSALRVRFGSSLNVYTVQVVVVVVAYSKPSPRDLNSVPYIWVKVTADCKQKKRVVRVGAVHGGLIHIPAQTGGPPSVSASDWFGWGRWGVSDVEIIERNVDLT